MENGGNGSLSAVSGCQKSLLICKLLLISCKPVSMSGWEESRSGILLPDVDHFKLYPGQRGFVWDLGLCFSEKKTTLTYS